MASDHYGAQASQRSLHTSFVWSEERILSGFVVDLADPAQRFVVELLIDGLSVKTRRADEYVFELAQQNIGDGCYGFSFFLRDEFVSEGLVAEARLANIDTLIGPPITFEAPDQGANGSPPGEIRWLGGLRFSGWLAWNADEQLDVLVDGELVTQTETSGWYNVGTDPESARAARAFSIELPERFADGRARQLSVIRRNGDALPGCPVAFVAFADGLARALARLDALESERLRAEEFDRLVPMSLPFYKYEDWRERFRSPVARAAASAAIVMVGDGDMDDTIESLHRQTNAQWVAVSVPASAAGAASFDPAPVTTFLYGDGNACDFVIFGLAGTMLAPTTLARIADAFARFEAACAVYGDVELTGEGGAVWPLAFSAFDYERLLEQGYCAYFFALRVSTAQQALAAGASDLYRLFNAVLDNDSSRAEKIVHIPGALAALPRIDPHAWQPALHTATRAHLEARGVVANVAPGEGHVMPAVRISRTIDNGRTTVIIPTRNRRKLLAQCIESIQPALKSRADIIVVDNDSSDPDTLDYLAMIEGDIAQVLRVPGDFNFARLNNIAASVATGDHLLLLNNDIKALDTDWLDEMLGRLAEPDVGAVGALLLWPSGIVQHGGVVLGPGFAATHAFNDRMRGDAGYGDLLRVAHQCSAVTAACLLTPRADFHLVGGLDELRFPVNFNDVDYCLKLRAIDKRIVFTPHAKLLHIESASRGNDKAADKRARLERELINLRTKWGTTLADDSYYNPTLSLDPIAFSALAWPPRGMAPRAARRPEPVIAPPGF